VARSVGLGNGGCLPLLVAASIVVVPSGMGGVRISQIAALCRERFTPACTFVTPLVDSVQTLRPARSRFHGGHGERRHKGACA
jgi:hypothetical protein